MSTVAIGLGCSLGDRRGRIERTLRRLDATDGLTWRATSGLLLSPPLKGGVARGAFLNAVARFDTELAPEQLLELCIALEDDAGRRRARRWADRTLDLDLLLYDDRVVRSERLTLPHPAIGLRPFVLHPLVEVWPDAYDPVEQRLWRDAPPPGGPRPVVVARVAPRRPLGYL
jgi:2-amino-4-hydroxy-6-hydroxymethyldihydropteridine diphosphokinase